MPGVVDVERRSQVGILRDVFGGNVAVDVRNQEAASALARAVSFSGKFNDDGRQPSEQEIRERITAFLGDRESYPGSLSTTRELASVREPGGESGRGDLWRIDLTVGRAGEVLPPPEGHGYLRVSYESPDFDELATQAVQDKGLEGAFYSKQAQLGERRQEIIDKLADVMISELSLRGASIDSWVAQTPPAEQPQP